MIGHAVGKNNVYYNIVFLSILASGIAYTVCTHKSVMRYFQQKSYINIRYSCVIGEFNVILNLIQNTKIDRKTHLCVCAWVCVSVVVPANGKYTSIRVREDRDKCPTGGCLLSISSYKLHRLLRSYYLRDPRDCGTRQEAVCMKGPENSKFTNRM